MEPDPFDPLIVAKVLALPRQSPLVRCDRVPIPHGTLRLATPDDLEQVCRDWPPLLNKLGHDDADWDWPQKAGDVSFPSDVEHVVLASATRIEGIMVTSLPVEAPALSKLAGLPLYVEYLATAPWNRPDWASQELKAVGPTLLRHAAYRSVGTGRRGRVGLHSLPGANDFYTKTARLDPRGPDLACNLLNYYEGDVEWSRAHALGPVRPSVTK